MGLRGNLENIRETTQGNRRRKMGLRGKYGVLNANHTYLLMKQPHNITPA